MNRFVFIFGFAILFVISCNLDEVPDYTGSGDSSASFTYSNSCETPLEMIFTNSSDLDGESFFWDFGDFASPVNTSTLENPTHIFSEAGTYTVKLTVDSSGIQATVSMEVDVGIVTFEHTFGGGVMDSAIAVVKAHDGGFFITGYSKSKGNDILIYKTNFCNNDLIYTSVSATGSSWGNSICQTNDGGYVIAGMHEYFGSAGYLVKLNGAGNVVQALEEYGTRYYSAIQLSNNDIIIAGSQWTEEGFFTFYDSHLYKTDANLGGYSNFLESGGHNFTNEYFQVIDISNQSVAAVGSIWIGFGNRIHFSTANYSFGMTHTYSIDKIAGDNSITASSLVLTEDNGFVITGWFNNVFDQDPPATYLKKISSTGVELWEADFVGGSGIIGQNEPTKVITTSDGGFLILGNHKLDATPDVFILKTDQNGNYLWDKSFGGSGKDFGNDVIECEDGGFLIVGYTESYNTSGEQGNIYIIKTDENGDMN